MISFNMHDMTMVFWTEQGSVEEKFAIHHVEIVRVFVDFPGEPDAELVERAENAPQFWYTLDVEDEETGTDWRIKNLNTIESW